MPPVPRAPSSPPSQPDPGIASDVLRSVLRAHGTTAMSTASGSLLLGLLSVVALDGSLPRGVLVAWGLVLIVLLTGRALLLRRAMALGVDRGGDEPLLRRALAGCRVGALLHGVAWGTLGLLLPLPADGSLDLTLIVVAGSLVVGSLALTTFDLRAGLAFCLPVATATAAALAIGGRPLPTEAGIVVGMVGVLSVMLAGAARRDRRERQDLAAARRAERASIATALRGEERLREAGVELAEKSRVLESTLESLSQGVLSLGPDGRSVAWNRRFLELLEVPEPLMAGRPTLEQITAWQTRQGVFDRAFDGLPEDVREGISRTAQGDYSALPLRYQRVTPAGRVLEIQAHFGADGSLVRTYSDITERVTAERALRESELRFRTLADGAPALIWLSDTEGRQTWFNQRWLAWRGTTLEEELALKWVERVHPDDHPVVAQAFRDAFDARRRYDTEFRLRRADGSWGWIADAGVPRFDPEGHFEGYVSYSWDISDRKAAADALRHAKDEAERANRAKSDFLSRMSHELRTPMNAILGFGQLLETDREHPLHAVQRARLQIMLRGGRHLLALINEVLDLARIESGALALHTEPVALAPLAGEALRLVQPMAAERGIRLDVDTDSLADARVLADRMRLEQVLLNLLSNAIKYNREGGRVGLALRPEAGGSAWRLEVSDEGPGIAPAQQARLFTAFERLDAGDSAIEGAGIGLALSKWLVELMGGTIGVDSDPGRGAVFWVRLQAADSTLPAREDSAEPAPTEPMPLAHRRVLYIEDNAVNQLLMEGMLSHRPGLELAMAEDPRDGLAQALADPPDLVLLDIQLPHLDGFEVLRRLRAHPATARVPVIAVSANAMPDDVEAARRAGFDHYLTKPLVLPRLLEVVDRALGVG